MELWDIRDIDFSKLEILNSVRSTESTLYFDDKLFYKFYDSLLTTERKKRNWLYLMMVI